MKFSAALFRFSALSVAALLPAVVVPAAVRRGRGRKAQPRRQHVAIALKDGDVEVYETGAVLLHIADRFPEAGLIPPLGDPRRPDVYRWVMWCANTLHSAWWPLMAPRFISTDESAADGIRERGLVAMEIGRAHV